MTINPADKAYSIRTIPSFDNRLDSLSDLSGSDLSDATKASKKIKQSYLAFQTKETTLSKNIQEALDIIEAKLPEKTFYVEKVEGEVPDEYIYTKPAPYKLIFSKPEEVKPEDYSKLKEQFIIFAKSSDIAASMVKKLLKDPEFEVGFIIDAKIKQDLKLSPTTYGYYDQNCKTFGILPENLGKEQIHFFQETLTHEFTHACDDLACPDFNGVPTMLSMNVLKEEIKPMFEKELKNAKFLADSLRELKIKKLKWQNPNISEKEIEESLQKMRSWRADKYSPQEVNLVKKNTWWWLDSLEHQVSVPLIAYVKLHGDKVPDINDLVIEYVAAGVTLYLSSDPAQRQRLKELDPQFYNYLETKFIPKILEEH